MAQQLRPEKFGEVPHGLPPAHADFLRKLRDAVEILVGDQRAKSDMADTPESQVVTFGDLNNAISGSVEGYSKIFMHMGAL